MASPRGDARNLLVARSLRAWMTTRGRITWCTRTVLAGLVAGCLVVPTAAAQAWSSPVAIGAPAAGEPNVLAVDRDGSAIIVWGTDVHRGLPGELTVDVVRAGGERSRWRRGRSVILDSARSSTGDLDLLVMEGIRSPYRLVLFRILRDGTVRRAWSTQVRRAATDFAALAMVARRGSRVAVAWLANSSGRRFRPQTLRLAISDRAGRWRAHAVKGVLPSWVDNHLGSVYSGDLAIGRAGDPVVAVTAHRRSRRMLVISSLTVDGAVRTRQLSQGLGGLVSMRATPSGRIGVLVEASGIEDFGECHSHGPSRRLSTVIRERGAERFGAAQLLAAPPSSCYRTQGRLVASTGNRLAVVWGTAPEVAPELSAVQVALADDNAPFTTPVTIGTGLVLRAATYGANTLTVSMIQPTSVQAPDSGPLFAQRFALTATRLEPIGASPAWGTVLSDGDRTGLVAVAWQVRPSHDLLLSLQRADSVTDPRPSR